MIKLFNYESGRYVEISKKEVVFIVKDTESNGEGVKEFTLKVDNRLNLIKLNECISRIGFQDKTRAITFRIGGLMFNIREDTNYVYFKDTFAKGGYSGVKELDKDELWAFINSISSDPLIRHYLECAVEVLLNIERCSDELGVLFKATKITNINNKDYRGIKASNNIFFIEDLINYSY